MSRIEADVAIIGGGLIGCGAAYALRKRGRSVVVLERGLVGGESSGVSFGSLRLQGHHIPELPLALRAQGLWEELEAELGEELGFTQLGHVHVALTDEHVARMERHAVEALPLGLRVELLDRRETIRRWPFLNARVLGSSWSARDAVVNPRLVAPALARAAVRLGAVVMERTPVLAVEHAGASYTLRCGGGLTVAAACLVNAAGAWAGEVAAQFGDAVPMFAAGPVELVTEPAPRFVRPVIHAVDGSVLFRQTGRGNVLIAGHPRIGVDAQGTRTRVPPAKMTTNMARLASLVPQMRAYHVIRGWTGIEAYLPDMLPVLGPSETMPGLFHAFGFSGHGLQLGPAVAAVLAELIVDGGTQTPIGLCAPGRFRAADTHAVPRLKEEFEATPSLR